MKIKVLTLALLVTGSSAFAMEPENPYLGTKNQAVKERKIDPSNNSEDREEEESNLNTFLPANLPREMELKNQEDCEEEESNLNTFLPTSLPWEMELKYLYFLNHEGLRSYLLLPSNVERLKVVREQCEEVYKLATPYVLKYLISSQDILTYVTDRQVTLRYSNLSGFIEKKIICSHDFDFKNTSEFNPTDLEAFCQILKKMVRVKTIELEYLSNGEFQPVRLFLGRRSILEALKDTKLEELSIGGSDCSVVSAKAFLRELCPHICEIKTLKVLQLFFSEDEEEDGGDAFQKRLHKIFRSIALSELSLTDLFVHSIYLQSNAAESLALLIATSSTLERVELDGVFFKANALNCLKKAIDSNTRFKPLTFTRIQRESDEDLDKLQEITKGHSKILWKFDR